jgi:hypothetical protein
MITQTLLMEMRPPTSSRTVRVACSLAEEDRVNVMDPDHFTATGLAVRKGTPKNCLYWQ